MNQNINKNSKIIACSQNSVETERYLNPSDIDLQPGYNIEVFAQGIDSPISMLFTETGDMIIAESGFTSGNARVLRLIGNNFEVIAEGFNLPITGINYLKGDIYVSHRGFITVIKSDGTRQNIITGLPSNGDYYNNRVIFSTDNKMYFGQGTATNSGVVGLDNEWVQYTPFFCDHPGDYLMLKGQNFATKNLFTIETAQETVYTGAYSPYSEPNLPFEVRKSTIRASGSILRANLDGSELELFAWGFRNPSYMKFDETNRLFVSNNGYEVRGSRPIANAPDEFFYVSREGWYGWPDYSGGDPVTLSRFRPEGEAQPEFLLASQPNIPPRPYATFPANSSIMGFDFNYNNSFGPYGDVYIAEFGYWGVRAVGITIPYPGIGQRISKIDMTTGGVTTFAINKSGLPASITLEGGFERPADVAFGPDGAMYLLDMGLNIRNDPTVFIANTGVIWKITRSE